MSKIYNPAKSVIFDAITRERAYQDKNHGTIHTNPHDVPGWILIVERELQEAKVAWVESNGDDAALAELLQVAATIVACLEQHYVAERQASQIIPNTAPVWCEKCQVWQFVDDGKCPVCLTNGQRRK